MSEEKKDDHTEGGIETSKLIGGGILIVVLFMVLFGLKGCYETKKSEDKNPTNTEQGIKGNNETPVFKFPTSGERYATRENPVKAFLNPLRSKTSQVNDDPSRTSRARYVLASNPNIYFDSPGPDSEWHKMPIGDYIIYPIDPQDPGIGFSWSLNQ